MIRIDFASAGWAAAGATRVRGCAHLGDRFLDARALAEALDVCATDTDWMATAARLNGCFAAVTMRGARVLAAVDRVRSIPLFYSLNDGAFMLSDDAYRVMSATAKPSALDGVADVEFHLTGYVTGAQTLHQDVAQLQAGEIVRFDPAQSPALEAHRYHAFHHSDFLSDDLTALIARLDSVHERVFRRLVRSVDGRPIAVPLSGGYDSRLIGVALRDLGLRDVVCYSYGVPGNWESRISQELARYLGFRWEFVSYSGARWREWASTDGFARYFHAAGNLASVPHLQDWPAVLELQREGRVMPDSVFVPGHSGDFLAGSHIPKSFAGHRNVMTRRDVLDSLQRAHYSLWDWPAGRRDELRSAFDGRIEAIVGHLSDCSPEDAADAFERWDLQERQAKFICNSVRVYEHFGFQWRLPLFDAELMDFWARVPVELRIGRRLYFEFARRRQALPIIEPNTDRGAIANAAIRLGERAGLRPAAVAVRRLMRRVRWRSVYTGSPLAWLELIDAGTFASRYTGKELLHSFLADRYREHAAGEVARPRREERKTQFAS